jgi:hypothetical protein
MRLSWPCSFNTRSMPWSMMSQEIGKQLSLKVSTNVDSLCGCLSAPTHSGNFMIWRSKVKGNVLRPVGWRQLVIFTQVERHTT